MALGSIRDGNAVPTLIELLLDDDVSILGLAIAGLTRSGDLRAVEPLAELYHRLARRDAALVKGWPSAPGRWLADLDLRLRIVTALRELDAPRGFDVFFDAARQAAFERRSSLGLKVNQAAYRLRRAGIYALGYTRSAAAASFLGEGALDDTDFRIRSAAVRALGILGQTGASDVLLSRLADPAAEVRWGAVLVLGRLGDVRSVEPLLGLLADESSEVRVQSVLALGYLGDRRVVESIEALQARESSDRVLDAVATTLDLLRRRG